MKFTLSRLLSLILLTPLIAHAGITPLIHSAPRPSVLDMQQLSEGEIAFKSKDYKKALVFYIPLAQRQNAFALYQLGYCRLNGIGADKDAQHAFTWFQKAAKKNLPEAKLAMGLMDYYGIGVPQDLTKAADLILQAATPHSEGGDYSPQAAYMMGVMHASGYGLDRNPPESLEWYRKAAALGLAQAQYNVGLYYYTGNFGGTVLPQDYGRAFTYFMQAAHQNHPKAQFMTGLMYSQGQGVAQDKKQSLYWYAQAAQANLTLAQYNLAVQYYLGDGVPNNTSFAIQLVRKAADSGLAAAQNLQGQLLMNGIGMRADPSAAIAWYQKAAQQGLAEAQFALGYYYYKGVGVHQDDRQALTWFLAAAKSGIVNAQYMIGLFYQQGIAVKPDAKMAAYWYNEAAMQGMENAQLMLGLMYAQGQGLAKDPRMAYAWFQVASASMNPVFHASVIQVRDELTKRMPPSELLLARRAADQLSARLHGTRV